MQMHNQIAYMGKLQITETPFVHVCNWPQQMVKYSRSPCAQLTCGMETIDKKEKRIKNLHYKCCDENRYTFRARKSHKENMKLRLDNLLFLPGLDTFAHSANPM